MTKFVVVAQKIEEGTKHIASVCFDTREEAQDVVDAYIAFGYTKHYSVSILEFEA